jgi:hypothetical protein
MQALGDALGIPHHLYMNMSPPMFGGAETLPQALPAPHPARATPRPTQPPPLP